MIGQYRSSFLLVEGREGLLIVDQHVAHERVLYERFLDRLASGKPVAQGLLEPVLVELDSVEVEAFEGARPSLAAAGIDAERFGETTVRILSLPPELAVAEAEVAVRELLDRVTAEAGDPGEGEARVRETLAASLACKAAIKVNHALTREEQLRLLHDLAETSDPYRCPHGRPIVLTLGQDEMERRLGRR